MTKIGKKIITKNDNMVYDRLITEAVKLSEELSEVFAGRKTVVCLLAIALNLKRVILLSEDQDLAKRELFEDLVSFTDNWELENNAN